MVACKRLCCLVCLHCEPLLDEDTMLTPAHNMNVNMHQFKSAESLSWEFKGLDCRSGMESSF